MKILSLFFASIMVSFAVQAADQTYGKATYQAASIKIADLMKDFSKYKGKKVVTEGEVYEVCTMEGCWLKLQDGDAKVRVVMNNHGFTVPKDIKGKRVKIEGVMEQKIMPAAMVRHYMKDEGRSEKEISAVKEPQKAFEFIADGVKAE
jgi:hypothetical protein